MTVVSLKVAVAEPPSDHRDPSATWSRSVPETEGHGADQGGWPPELVALYRERRLALVRVAYLLTSDREVAEELVHDSVLAMRPHWPDIAEPRAYLRAAVVNRSRSWLRRQRTERTHQPGPQPDAALEADEMWDALGHLDERRRAAIVLRFYEDVPDADIAEILGCRPATVRTLIHRGLQQLRAEIER